MITLSISCPWKMIQGNYYIMTTDNKCCSNIISKTGLGLKIKAKIKATSKSKPKPSPQSLTKREPVSIGHYSYYENFYLDTKPILDWLNGLNYQSTYYYLFGKITRSPRKMLWFTEDPALKYVFSNNHIEGLATNPFPKSLTDIKNDVQEFTGQKFNAVLINRYEPGDSIDWHNDNDKWCGKDFIVPSLSFGATRTFKFRLQGSKTITDQLELTDGSLVVMENSCQNAYDHSIPKQKSRHGVRYNLTFRYIVPGLEQYRAKHRTVEYIMDKYKEGKLKGGEEYITELLALSS